MALLEVRNLHVRVEDDGQEILHGLSLTVNKGEVHAIMGPNGSGKSTLSHVLAGKPGYEVTSGEVRSKAKTSSRWSPISARQRACSSRSSIRWKFPASPP